MALDPLTNSCYLTSGGSLNLILYTVKGPHECQKKMKEAYLTERKNLKMSENNSDILQM